MICESHYRWFQTLKVVMSYLFITSSITTLSAYVVVSQAASTLLQESHIGARSEDNSMHLRPQDVYSKRRIIAVTKVEIVEWKNYKHLDWITVRSDDDILYKFKECDFHRRHAASSRARKVDKSQTLKNVLHLMSP
ncbi:hypothetical protein Tco_1198686 [Tanacetum coccineum]